MKILIAEDDGVSASLLQALLKEFGYLDVVANGEDALSYFNRACEKNEPYDLICLDIMMPKIDGQQVLQQIRDIERVRGVDDLNGTKIIMVSALDDSGNILTAFQTGCEAYMTKPVEKAKLIEQLVELGLIEAPSIKSD